MTKELVHIKELYDKTTPQQQETICADVSSVAKPRFAVDELCVCVELDHCHIFGPVQKNSNVLEKMSGNVRSKISGYRSHCHACILLYLGHIPKEIMGNSKYFLKIFTRQNKKKLLVNGHRLIQRQLDDWLEIIEYLHEMENTDFSAETEK